MPNNFPFYLAHQFVIKANGWSYIVTYDDLVYIKVCDHFCSFYFNGVTTELKVRMALSSLYLPKGFVKIKKNCVVNTKHMCSYAAEKVNVKWNDDIVGLESRVPVEQFDELFGPTLNASNT